MGESLRDCGSICVVIRFAEDKIVSEVRRRMESEWYWERQKGKVRLSSWKSGGKQEILRDKRVSISQWRCQSDSTDHATDCRSQDTIPSSYRHIMGLTSTVNLVKRVRAMSELGSWGITIVLKTRFCIVDYREGNGLFYVAMVVAVMAVMVMVIVMCNGKRPHQVTGTGRISGDRVSFFRATFVLVPPYRRFHPGLFPRPPHKQNETLNWTKESEGERRRTVTIVCLSCILFIHRVVWW